MEYSKKELIEKLNLIHKLLIEKGYKNARISLGALIFLINSDAQAESPTVGDNEDEKEECEHPYAWVRSKCGYDKCLKCGKVLSEG